MKCLDWDRSSNFFCAGGFSFPTNLFVIWCGLWPLWEVTQAFHKMLIFDFFILWKAIEQSLEEFGMLASETGGELVGWGSCIPVSVGDFFLRAWQKCQWWLHHWANAQSISGLCPQKNLSFKNPDRVCNSPMPAIIFVIFCLLIWVMGAFSPGLTLWWPRTHAPLFSQYLQWEKPVSSIFFFRYQDLDFQCEN